MTRAGAHCARDMSGDRHRVRKLTFLAEHTVQTQTWLARYVERTAEDWLGSRYTLSVASRQAQAGDQQFVRRSD